MIQRLKRLLGLVPKEFKNLLIINSGKLETRVALLEGGSLEEYSIERSDARQLIGSVFKGRVKNIEHGLKAMFVDIGIEKNAFLHFWDAIPAALDSGIETIERGGTTRKQKPRITSKDIPNIYPVGSEVQVMVTKGPIGNKGPRITTNISLAGRYLVFMPYNDQSGISRKIESPKERRRLREILEKLELPEGSGVIMRTVGEGQRARYFVRDLHLLLEQWRAIQEGWETKTAPACIFQEPDLVERTVRDFLTEQIDAIYCDDSASVDRMRTLVGQISRRARKRVNHYTEDVPIFERFNVERELESAFRRQVWLKCGGYIVIDETEALIAVDVNTGRNKGNKDIDKTILETNLEAADELARQLRLRNIGGLIVADFIDMKPKRDQQAVYNRLRERLKRDKAKTHVLPVSPLGLIEMTRQRVQESITETVYKTCQNCAGRGVVKSAVSMSVEIQRALDSVMRRHQDAIHEFTITVHPEVLQRLRSEDEELLLDLERKWAARLAFRSDTRLTPEKYIIADSIKGTVLNESM